ncbi:hypothetical protein BGZ94_006313, partial [Podila epigama]
LLCIPVRRMRTLFFSRIATLIAVRLPRRPLELKLSLLLRLMTNVLTAASVSTLVWSVAPHSHPSASSGLRLCTSVTVLMAHLPLLRTVGRVDALSPTVMTSATRRMTAPALEVELHPFAVLNFQTLAMRIPIPSTSAVVVADPSPSPLRFASLVANVSRSHFQLELFAVLILATASVTTRFALRPSLTSVVSRRTRSISALLVANLSWSRSATPLKPVLLSLMVPSAPTRTASALTMVLFA